MDTFSKGKLCAELKEEVTLDVQVCITSRRASIHSFGKCTQTYVSRKHAFPKLQA
jgi:hypothetical protein